MSQHFRINEKVKSDSSVGYTVELEGYDQYNFTTSRKMSDPEIAAKYDRLAGTSPYSPPGPCKPDCQFKNEGN